MTTKIQKTIQALLLDTRLSLGIYQLEGSDPRRYLSPVRPILDDPRHTTWTGNTTTYTVRDKGYLTFKPPNLQTSFFLLNHDDGPAPFIVLSIRSTSVDRRSWRTILLVLLWEGWIAVPSWWSMSGSPTITAEALRRRGFMPKFFYSMHPSKMLFLLHLRVTLNR